MSDTPSNTFLEGPLWATYLKTAHPTIFVIATSGLLAVADGALLGLAKPYQFAIPMTFILTATVFAITAQRGLLRWGVFHTITGENL